MQELEKFLIPPISTQDTQAISLIAPSRHHFTLAFHIIFLLISGNVSLRAKASPLLNRALFEAARKVPNPNNQELAAGRSSVYDTWVQTFPSSTPGEPR